LGDQVKLAVFPEDTFGDLKQSFLDFLNPKRLKIDKFILYPGVVRLTYGVFEIEDDERISDHDIENDATLSLHWKDKGTIVTPEGYKYQGELHNGLDHGKGKAIWPCGIEYIGEFQEGKRHGKGITIYTTGSEYTGEFREGERHGKGVLIYSNGNRLVCQCNNGRIHGPSILIRSSGLMFDGVYERGLLKEQRIRRGVWEGGSDVSELLEQL